jgi:peptidoglycan/LPS O-acetylase OafA/YrhL
MKRRDILWIAVIWMVLLTVAAAVTAFFPDPDDDPATNDTVGYWLFAGVLGALATGLYVLVRRRPQNRRDILWIAGIWTAVFALAGTAAAAFPDDDPRTDDASGAGALAAIVGGLATALYLFVRERSQARELRDVPRRQCPSCAAVMPLEASRCPAIDPAVVDPPTVEHPS